MKFLGFTIGGKEAEVTSEVEVIRTDAMIVSPMAQFTGYGNGAGTYRNLFSWSFNGEKNLGGIGPIKNYWIDYESLRARSWQAYLDSELAQTILKKFGIWVIGKGLRLQSEPMSDILESEGITIDAEKFSKTVEARFQLFAKSNHSDYSGMANLNKIQKRAHKNAIVGGDVLVILRYIDDCVKVQLIDGAHVQQPIRVGNNVSIFELSETNCNRIENGIELSPTNEHIAYYVRKPGINMFESVRIPAKGKKTGLRMAYLVYGSEYRIDNMRGLPLLSVVMETLKKLERYKEATVGSAEELAKISYQIVHQQFSTGESPLLGQLAKAHDAEAGSDLPIDIEGRDLANTVAATQEKQTYNMPVGSELKTINPNKYQLYFKDFYGVNGDSICASVGIPPDVAMSKYNSNYSASRAAIKDWEHTLNVERDDFGGQFLKPIYQLWLYTEVLKNKVVAPGFIEAFMSENYMVCDAYCMARWSGPSVPHIDPLKEVQSERAKLGATSMNIPLTTVESATEALNSGDADANMAQYARELELNETLGIEPEEEEVMAAKPKKKPNP